MGIAIHRHHRPSSVDHADGRNGAIGKAGHEAETEHLAKKVDGFDPELEQALRQSDVERARHVVGGDAETQARIDALHTQKPSEAHEATDAIAAGRIDRTDFQRRVFDLIGAEFSTDAQQGIVQYLTRVRDPHELGWAASALRRVLPNSMPSTRSGKAPLDIYLNTLE
ncbi:MAG: hypothetical protein AAB426_13920, partial [Myxococcota bacterium]